VDIPQNAGYTDYYLNKNAGDGLQTLPIASNPSYTILIGEGGSTSSTPLANSTARFRTNGCNGAGDATNLDRTSPVCPGPGLATNLGGGGQRHTQGANFGFIDGHSKWYKGATTQSSNIVYNGMTTFTQSGSNPTFHLHD
jgi:prepilin-type processing-associated H-X9-DG protein